MELRRIGTIFRKELLDTLRDRKTLIFMVALPTLLAPGLMAVMSRVMTREARKTQERRLVVQAEPADRERLVACLRGRLAELEAQVAPLLARFGPELEAPLAAIATELGRTPFEVLASAALDPAVRDHPRFAELQRSFSGGVGTALQTAGGGAGAPALDAEAFAQGRQVIDLLSPLVTLDFVDAAQAAARPASHPPIPEAELTARARAEPRLASAAQAVATRRIHAWIAVPAALGDDLAQRDDEVQVELLYDSTIDSSNEAQRRLSAALAAAGRRTVVARLRELDLPETFLTPIAVAAINTAPSEKQALKVIAGILPYLLILMCFVGGLYPATDLGAGEKERLTLETLLVSPAGRGEIALGKFGVVLLGSLVAGLLATGSMAWTFASGLADARLGALLQFDLAPSRLLVCLALIAPLAAVFAAVMLALSIYARSQKEAQSLMMPLQFLIIVPAMLSLIPTIELDLAMAWIPVMNVALGLRAVLTAGGAALPWAELAIIFGSTLLFAGATLALCAWQFRREAVIFRS